MGAAHRGWLLALCLVSCRGGEEKALKAWGTVDVRVVDVSTRTMGRVARVLVEEGETVAMGQEVVRLDLSDLEAQRLQAAGALEAADAQLRLLQAGTRAEDIASAQKNLAAAEDTLRQRERDWERAQNLLEQKAIAIQTAQQAQTAMEVARANVQSQEANVQKLLVGARSEELQAAAAQRGEAQAALQRIEDLLRDRSLPSAIDGVVLVRMVEADEVVMPGAPLLRLGEVGRPYIDVYVPEPRAGAVQPGASVQVRLDTYPDRVFQGRVRFLSPDAEFTPKNVQTESQRSRLVFRTRVDILEGEGLPLRGMPGQVTFSEGAPR